MDFLTQDIIDESVRYGAGAILKFINLIYFNDKHPENHNVRLCNVRNQIIEVFEDQNWVLKNANDILEKIYLVAKTIILQNIRVPHLSEIEEDNPITYKEAHENFNDYISMISTFMKEKKKIKQNIFIKIVERKKLSEYR